MPRANRYFLPGHVWHVTHRCHEKAFLLRFARDRRRYLYWLFEARKRYGLCVLDYMVTSNHVHLLVQDAGNDAIPRAMQLVAGRTAQEYNMRKRRQGAFWEDRYHATAIEADEHLHRCLVYIDLNMVRAGAVRHPAQWMQAGYREIQEPPARYRIIDAAALCRLCGVADVKALRRLHRQWIEDALGREPRGRDKGWSDTIADGSTRFVKQVKAALGTRAAHRNIETSDEKSALREPTPTYLLSFAGKSEALRSIDTPSRRKISGTTGT